ncbi:MAG: type II restriction endonuclease [Akkermansia sp.]|nr:type II restriction endonuclease [Akkermansia sp.]
MSDTRFQTFLSQLKETNAGLDFYSDFTKIGENVSEIAFSLNTLNYLIGKSDIANAVHEIWERDKKAFEVMDILIATRKKDNKLFLDAAQNAQPIHSLFESEEGVVQFLEETGLADVFRQQKIKDLVDFVFGVETGLDSNARKNRSGFIMEKRVADILSAAGIPYEEQVSSRKYPALEQVLGVDQKVFDFVITTPSKVYLMEVNFYSGGGSKLNETARSYTDVAPKVNSLPKFEFVWITDGQGWHSAKNKLQEAFAAIPSIYNLTTISEFVSKLRNELA